MQQRLSLEHEGSVSKDVTQLPTQGSDCYDCTKATPMLKLACYMSVHAGQQLHVTWLMQCTPWCCG